MKALRTTITALAALALSGTASHGQDRLLGMVEPVKAKKEFRIAYASADMNSDFWLGMAYGVTEESKEAGVRIVRITSAGGYGKVAEQIAQLEQLRTMDLDAVILSSAAFDGYDKVVERLTEKGIKVVILGTPIGSPKVSFGIMQNEIGIGNSIGSYICQSNPKALVITLPGPAGSAWNKLRFDGFKAAAEKCPEMKLVGNNFGGNIAIEEGQRQAGDLLLKHPDADYIYAVAGIFSVGVAQQVRRMNSKAKVVTGTLTRRSVELVKNGSIAMIVSEPAIVFGRAAVQYTVRQLNGDPLPKLVPGIMPYPVALIPNVALTGANIDKHDTSKYDLPPEGWRPPQLQ